MYSILIVDDETILLEGIKEVIEESDLPFKEIRTASSAQEALAMHEQTPFDILLSDISMPQMDGLIMAEHMKEIYPYMEVKMMILISHRSGWDNWIELAGKMINQVQEREEFGALCTYEERTESDEASSEEAGGNMLMYKVRDYIRQNPGMDLSLGRLAFQFHINPSYLSRSFHQTIQSPLSSYIAQVRMERAKQLLTETDERIYEIAQKVGFDTQGYFTKVFNRMVGMSPKEYRMNNKSDK